uniref:Uncharacterized protein n=1 Tax=Arundo donax TaxID=35708 RepID=A0A0A9U745_ARUDO
MGKILGLCESVLLVFSLCSWDCGSCWFANCDFFCFGEFGELLGKSCWVWEFLGHLPVL